MEIDVKKISYISYFLCFSWFSNMISSAALILPASQLRTQQVMMSQIGSHIEYTYSMCDPICDLLYSFAHFVVEIGEKSSHSSGF